MKETKWYSICLFCICLAIPFLNGGCAFEFSAGSAQDYAKSPQRALNADDQIFADLSGQLLADPILNGLPIYRISLTTRVKVGPFPQRQPKIRGVQIDVNNRIIVLEGVVDTAAQAKRVNEIAVRIQGINWVLNHLEVPYLAPN